MTTSGIAALIIAKAALEEKGKYKSFKKKCDQAIRDGAAWLSQNFTVTCNPNRDMYHYYFLYGMERAGVLSLCQKWGEHDWYAEGAKYLLGDQNADGSWRKQQRMDVTGQVVNTCFAILFLCRATTPIVPGFAETGGYLDRDGKKEKKK